MADRVQPLMERASRSGAQSNMARLLSVLTPSSIVPEVDKYYVFVYKAKTKNIQYDQHPFVVVTGVYRWGFSGYNFHLEQPRRYSWNEVQSNIYFVSDDELNSVQNYPIALIKSS